jgi:SAM-dependent methyltransferase
MKDVLGQAIADFFHDSFSGKLWVHTRWGDTGKKESMPVNIYFRQPDDMPQLEWTALQHCKGKVLDVGAGAGSHSLFLQQTGLDVTALDISPLNAMVMKQRGIKKVLCRDFFTLEPSSLQPASTGPAGRYDTLLLLMNGIGLTASLDGLHTFLQKARTLLLPGGSLIFDSSDVAYLYQGHPPKKGPYYGEILYQYEYRRQRTDWFKWLFIDRRTLLRIAKKEGWKMQLLFEDKFDQYLVKLSPIDLSET